MHGTEVYGQDGTHIGEIDHLIIDKVSGRVAYAVMSFGGFPGDTRTRCDDGVRMDDLFVEAKRLPRSQDPGRTCSRDGGPV